MLIEMVLYALRLSKGSVRVMHSHEYKVLTLIVLELKRRILRGIY